MKKLKLFSIITLIFAGIVIGAVFIAGEKKAFASPIVGNEDPDDTFPAPESTTETEATAKAEVKTDKKDALNIKYNTVCSNVFSFGTSLSGLTKADALDAMEETKSEALGAKLRAVSADGDKTWEATLKELGVTIQDFDGASVIEENILKGSPLTRYKKAKALEKEPLHLTAGLNVEPDVIRTKIEDALTEWNQDVKEASATVRNGSLEVIPGQNGHRYDFTKGANAFIEALQNGKVTADGFDLESEYTTVEPTLSTDKVKTFTVIGSFTTGYAAPSDQISKNREQNLITSIGNVNGHVFAPGEVVSALSMYGPVTAANGYAVAGTYSATGHTDELGGGICQSTTTIYNAALMAELEIVYRRNHSHIVNYVDPSLDAMVYAASGSDFKFKNSSSDYIIMDSWVNTGNHTLTVNIIGHEDHPASHSVKYVSVVESKTMPTVTNVINNNLKCGFGTAKFTVPANFFIVPAVVSTSYKVVYENGKEVSRTKLTHDVYKASNGTVYVAPDVRAEAVETQNRSDNYVSLQNYFIDSHHTSIAAPWGQLGYEAQMQAEMNEKIPGWTPNGVQGGGDPTPPESSSEEPSSSEPSSSPSEPSTPESSPEP